MGGPVRRWDGTRPLKRLTPYYLALNQWVLRRLLEPKQCGSAWKKDPVSGVIGVQKGPLISVV